ncbi:MAG: CvpA family protein [Clostridia bacterium]|nr:CvpA family protein [Clostridia bacterium]
MLQITTLCANWTNFIADVVVLCVLVLFCILCAKKGFINCLLGFISNIVAIFVAVVLTKVVISITGGWFGVQDAMASGFENALLNIKGFDTDISQTGMSEALASQNVPAFLSNLLVDTFANAEVEQGTTLAMVTGDALSGHAITLITWIVLFFVTRFVFFVLKKFFTVLTSKIKLLGAINTALGAVIGLIEGLLIVYGVLAILTLIPVAAISTYLNSSLLVSQMYNHNLIFMILGWIMA